MPVPVAFDAPTQQKFKTAEIIFFLLNFAVLKIILIFATITSTNNIMKRMYQWILTAAIMLAYALGIEAQGVMTTDAMIRVAEQNTKMESRASDRNNKLSTQQPVLTFVVKVADENAADTYARLREHGVIIRGRIGQQAIVEVPLNKVETLAQMDGILRVDVGHQGQLKTDVGRQVMGVNHLNGSNPTVPSPFTGKGVTVCVMDIGMDFKHPPSRMPRVVRVSSAFTA